MQAFGAIKTSLRKKTTCEKGQSTVELAFLLPTLVLMALLFLQCLVVFVHRIELSEAARAAVRVASVSGSHSKIVAAGKRATGLSNERLKISSEESPHVGGFVRVVASYDDPIVLPIVNRTLFTVHMQAASEMMVER